MKRTVERRIAIGFGLAALALIVLSLVSFIAIEKIHAGMDDNIKAREYRRAFDKALKAHLIWSETVGRSIIDPEKKALDVVLDPRECDFGKWYYSEARQEVEEFAPQLVATLSILAAPHERLHDAGKEISRLLENGDRAAASTLYLESILPLRGQIEAIYNDIYTDVTKNVLSDNTMAAMVDAYRMTIGSIGLVSCIVIIAFAFFLSRGIKTMLNETINALSTTSTEIAATVTQHERTATQQATMVNETSSTMAELAASSRKTAEQAEAAAGVAQKATTLTQEGSESVKSALEAMSNLKGKIEAVARQILRLSEQTIQVGGIAELVKDLSTQINMLALNAAVEAARAGEHGKGFAVVAGEVRKLAAESKKSSEQAKTILAEIQKATNSTIMVTEEGTKQVEEVVTLARKVGALFLSLSETADQVFNTAQQVLLNARQQTLAVGQVTEASNAINAGAKETAAGISQTKVGILKLNEAAQNLKAMI